MYSSSAKPSQLTNQHNSDLDRNSMKSLNKFLICPSNLLRQVTVLHQVLLLSRLLYLRKNVSNLMPPTTTNSRFWTKSAVDWTRSSVLVVRIRSCLKSQKKETMLKMFTFRSLLPNTSICLIKLALTWSCTI